MTLAQLVTEINAWMNRSDVTDAQIYNFINSFIRKIEMANNFKHMQVKYEKSLSEDDYVFTNPITNYKALVDLPWIYDSNGYKSRVVRKDYNYAMSRYPDLTNSKGRPVYISDTVAAESSLSPDIAPTRQLILRPTCDTSYTLEINAFQYSPALDGSTYTTNWWTANAWDFILFGALGMAALFLRDADAYKMCKAEAKEYFDLQVSAEVLEEISASDLTIEPDEVSLGTPAPYANDYLE